MNTAVAPRPDLNSSAVERLFDALDDALLLFDAGGVRYANLAARRLLGATPGIAAAQLQPALGRAAVEWLQRALAGGPPAGPAPAARLGDGRSAALSLLKLDAERQALLVKPLPAVAAPATPGGLPPVDSALDVLWSSPWPATLQDLDFRLVAVNRAYLDFTGYPESMLLGLDPITLQPEEDRAATRGLRERIDLAADALQPPPLVERRLVDAGGRVRCFRAMRRPLRDAAGRTLLLAVYHDTTDEQQARLLAERALADLEHWLDFSPIGMAQLDPDGLLVRSNAAFEALVGAAPVSLADAPPALRELLGFDAAGPVAALQPGAPPLRREALLAGDGGAPRRLRATLRCIEGGSGRRVLALVEDCSAEDERDLARLQLGALVDAAGVGLATFHDAGRLPRDGGGPASLQAIGALSVDRAIVEPASLPDFERLQRALRDGDSAEVRYAVRHPDIGRRWLLTRVQPGQLRSGRRTTSVVTLDVTEPQLARERSDALLRELSSVLEHAHAGIALLRDDRLVRCNRAFGQLLRLDSGALRADQPLAALRAMPANGARATQRGLEMLEAALQALADQPLFETEFDSGDEPPQWYSLSVHRGAADGAVEATAVLIDITRQRVQQAALQSLSRQHAAMFERSGIAAAYLRGGRIERANAAFAALTGHAAGALPGLDYAALFEDRAEYLRIGTLVRVALAAGGEWSGERRLRRADGTLRWVQADERLLRPGEPAGGTLVSFVDVDDRRRAEESLLAQAEGTRAILDSVLVGIVKVDAGGIRWLNRSARRMFGGEAAEFIDQPIAVVATDEPDHPLRRTALLDELDEGEAYAFECRLRARDGRVFRVAGNAVLTGRAGGAPQLTYALLDIERRRGAG